MQQINLLDARLLPARHALSGHRLIVLGIVGLVLALIHLGLAQRQLTQTLVDAGMAPQPEVVAITGASDGDVAMQARIGQRETLRDMLAKADQLPRNSAALLRAVIAALPNTVWLSAVDLNGTAGLRIAGGATDPAALHSFAERLAAIAALRDMPIETLRIEPNVAASTDDKALPSSHSFVLASVQYMASETDR